LIGWHRHESFYHERPTSYWREEILTALHERDYQAPDTILAARDPAAVPVPMELLHDEHPYVRRLAVEALGRMGPIAEPALPALIEASKDPVLRPAALKALKAIDPGRAAELGAN
jgi:HEAT repeat protein